MLAGTASASAATVPFTEEFVSDSANWYDAAGTSPLGWQAAGGPDGGSYALGTFNFAASAAGDTPVVLRGQDEFDFSGGAFVGDWVADGVTQFSATVWHDAGVPLTFFVRFAGPNNIPGGTALNFVPVPGNAWTPISVAIEPTNPQFITFEGQSFEAVFTDVGHIQIGVSVPDDLAGVDASITFGLDKVSIVPEPSMLMLLSAGAGLGLVRQRRRVGRC